ncbi:MAG: amidophosphoribosyltransferase [Deltaproteobacteria bacterium]|nr:amidophosphoribosyltransferase [Deltaproteobacteria bacterium]
MCGIVGIYNHPEASRLAYLGLYALQHRGQEAAGITSSDGGKLYSHRQMGLVADIFSEENLNRLIGSSAIGHVRYSTTGASNIKNIQPLKFTYAHGGIAVSHNGNLTNAQFLRKKFEQEGSIFQSTTDTEVIIHLMAKNFDKDLHTRIVYALGQVEGAYSLVFLTETKMIAARDPYGWRPLVLGDLNGSPVVASETCALDLIEAKFVREVEPGEVLIFSEKGTESFKPFDKPKKKAYCIFEHVYFSRPDSEVFGRNVYETRKGFGQALAKENPIEADMVVAVPDSGVPAALGYSEESGIPFQMGLIRNHYIGRTFIEPTDNIRHFGVKIKLNAVKGLVEGKRIILVDDSVVRGTTCRKIVSMLKDAGVKEVHFRVSSPPTSWPCFFGIDTPERKQLIAAQKSLEEIRQFIGCDTLAYLSEENLFYFQKNYDEWFCDACFSGKFPISLKDHPDISNSKSFKIK